MEPPRSSGRNVRRSISFAGPSFCNRSTVYSVTPEHQWRYDHPLYRDGSTLLQAKLWARKLGIFKPRRHHTFRESDHVLQGEFLLREQPHDGATDNLHRDSQETPYSRLKFRPAPLSFPPMEEMERGVDFSGSDDDVEHFTHDRFRDPYNNAGGRVTLNPDPAHRQKSFFYYGADRDVGLYSEHIDIREGRRMSRAESFTSGRSMSNGDLLHLDRNHNHKPPWHTPKYRSSEEINRIENVLDDLDLGATNPNFIGAFHVEDKVRISRPDHLLPLQHTPVPPPRKKKEKKKLKFRLRKKKEEEEEIYDEAADIEAMLDDLYNTSLPVPSDADSTDYNSYMNWPDSSKHREVHGIDDDYGNRLPGDGRKSFYYSASLPNVNNLHTVNADIALRHSPDGAEGLTPSSTHILRPPDPPEDYSPMANRHNVQVRDVYESNDYLPPPPSRALPPVPSSEVTFGTSFQDPPLPQTSSPILTTTAPPPPPPPPPPLIPLSKENPANPNSISNGVTPAYISDGPRGSFADQIIRKQSELKKTEGPGRKSRAPIKTNNVKANVEGPKVSSKIGHLRNALESDIMAPYVELVGQGPQAGYENVSDSLERCKNIEDPPSDTSRDNSPVHLPPLRSLSPSKFTYLPNAPEAILARHKLRKVGEGKDKESHARPVGHVSRSRGTKSSVGRSQSMSATYRKPGPPPVPVPTWMEKRRRATDLYAVGSTNDNNDEVPPSDKPVAPPRVKHTLRKKQREEVAHVHRAEEVARVHRSEEVARVHRAASFDRSSTPPANMEISEDDFHKLQTNLLRHLERPSELPNLNMRTVKQYDKLPDAPSELELFFKKRREQQERQETEGAAATTGLQTAGASLVSASIFAMSQLVENDVNSARNSHN